MTFLKILIWFEFQIIIYFMDILIKRTNFVRISMCGTETNDLITNLRYFDIKIATQRDCLGKNLNFQGIFKCKTRNPIFQKLFFKHFKFLKNLIFSKFSQNFNAFKNFKLRYGKVFLCITLFWLFLRSLIWKLISKVVNNDFENFDNICKDWTE